MEKVKLTILGSGTGVPNGERNSAGYFVESPGVRMMMDCGAGTVHALAGYGVPWERMTHLFISHFHVDHVGELAALFFAFKYGMSIERTEPLTVIGPTGLERVMEGLKSAYKPDLFETEFPVESIIVDPGDRLELDSETVLSVTKTPHNKESLAVRIDAGDRCLCYTGDTSYSDDVARFFAGASTLISECSFLDRVEMGRHLSATDAAMLARGAGALRLIVTHFYFEVDEHELARRLREQYSGEIIVGRDGLVVTI
jgi:ribonuclease BN (tRNA processing enzyme)